jgi:tRNA(fMet)-specific endonuclease VapC
MSRILLDTSGYSAFRRGHAELKSALQRADIVFVSPTVLGELLAGFRHGKHRLANEKSLYQFLNSTRVVVVDIIHETAIRYAEILSFLRGIGSPIATNDIWIAASAMEHGLRLLTTDAHFRVLPQISVDCFDVL